MFNNKIFNKRIAAMSDLHGVLPEVNAVDAVFIVGDIFPYSSESVFNRAKKWFVENFMKWVNELECDKVFLTPGNHDFALQNSSVVEQMVAEAVELHSIPEDKFVFLSAKYAYGYGPYDVSKGAVYDYDGIRVYGDPHCENLYNYAFYTPNPHKQYNTIPMCDILLTHQPPDYEGLGISHSPKGYPLANYGSKELFNTVNNMESKPYYWFCGHVHTGVHDLVRLNNTQIYNVSLSSESKHSAYGVLYLYI